MFGCNREEVSEKNNVTCSLMFCTVLRKGGCDGRWM